MKRWLLPLLLLLAGPAFGQGMCTYHHQTWTEHQPVSGTQYDQLALNERLLCESNVSPTTYWNFAGGRLGLPKGTSVPGTCTTGEVYWQTSDNTFQCCSATNTWTTCGGGGGGGDIPDQAFDPLRVYNYVNEATIAADINTNPALVFEPAVFWATNGTGAVNARNSTDAEQGHPAIIEQQTGTTSVGKAAVNSNGTFIRFGGGVWTYLAVVRIPTLSTGSERFVYRAGFVENTGGDSTDGVYLRYSDNLSSGAWECVARSNNSETATSTAVTVVANTWYNLKITVNAAGTSATCLVNGAGSTTVSSNVPNASGRTTGFGASMNKTVGTTMRYADLDMFAVHWVATTTR